MARANDSIRKHRFRTTIRKRGANPYVEVPERISRAMAGQARAGYIRVAGTLNRVSIRATLVPTGGGRHRLYVNGGMQSAAGVTVGDTVTFHIQAMRPETVRPRCGNEFVNRNQYHSCKRRTLDEPFAGKPARIRSLFERFRAMVEGCGPVKMLPYRDKVAFMVRVRFAGAFPRSRWLEVGFWLPRRVEHPRFTRIETLYPNAHIHRLRITESEQLDRELAGWLKEAYAVGCQEHLGSSP